MKQVQNASFDNRAIEELCRRYRDRGMNYSCARESAEQEENEICSRTVAPRSYKTSSEAAYEKYKYKNGVENGRRYMTEGDFVNFYRATREYAPTYDDRLDTAVILDNIDRKRYKKPVPDKVVKKDVKAQLKIEAQKANPKPKRTAEQDLVQANEIRKAPSKIDKKTKKADVSHKKSDNDFKNNNEPVSVTSMITFAAVALSFILIVGSGVIFSII